MRFAWFAEDESEASKSEAQRYVPLLDHSLLPSFQAFFERRRAGGHSMGARSFFFAAATLCAPLAMPLLPGTIFAQVATSTRSLDTLSLISLVALPTDGSC